MFTVSQETLQVSVTAEPRAIRQRYRKLLASYNVLGLSTGSDRNAFDVHLARRALEAVEVADSSVKDGALFIHTWLNKTCCCCIGNFVLKHPNQRIFLERYRFTIWT